MMHIGFSELILTSLIALIVIKPQQWPELLQQFGRWIGHCKRIYRTLQIQLHQSIDPLTKIERDDS